MTRSEAGVGVGAGVGFALGECSLGFIVIGATEGGVCAILLGDDLEELTRDIKTRFPEAVLRQGDKGLEYWMAAVIACIETPTRELDLPLDLRGTPFQQQVWHALRQIPPGTTTSYAQLARRIGRPQAARAVARACAANAVAVAVPCHRVVGSNGALSGYRWGVERKRALLARETERRGQLTA